jgi:hypothetical protein
MGNRKTVNKLGPTEVMPSTPIIKTRARTSLSKIEIGSPVAGLPFLPKGFGFTMATERLLELEGKGDVDNPMGFSPVALPSEAGISAHCENILTSRDPPREEFCPQFTEEGVITHFPKTTLRDVGVRTFLQCSNSMRDTKEGDIPFPLFTHDRRYGRWNTPRTFANSGKRERRDLLPKV